MSLIKLQDIILLKQNLNLYSVYMEIKLLDKLVQIMMVYLINLIKCSH